MKKTIKALVISLLCLCMLIPTAAPVYAEECEHEWEVNYRTNIQQVSATKHSAEVHYTCHKCWQSKVETVEEKHTFDDYKVCTICHYVKPRTITLKPKTEAKVNGLTWVKIVVDQKGYLILEGSRYGWKIYNSSKKAYPHQYINFNSEGKAYIPVLKGTYYLYMNDSDYYDTDTIKYTFKKDPAKTNYTKKTAISLKAKTEANGVIYTSAAKKTWTRWYKIKLTKAQYIKFDRDVHLETSKGKYVKIVSDYDKHGNRIGYITGNKQKAGTYYVIIGAGWETTKEKSYAIGTYYSFSWK